MGILVQGPPTERNALSYEPLRLLLVDVSIMGSENLKVIQVTAAELTISDQKLAVQCSPVVMLQRYGDAFDRILSVE